MRLYLILIGVMSLVAFVAFGLDKIKAKRSSQRISERRLLLMSLAGGATGALLAMLMFRHKTRHLKFIVGVPLLLALQLWLLSVVL